MQRFSLRRTLKARRAIREVMQERNHAQLCYRVALPDPHIARSYLHALGILEPLQTKP
jgi:ParB-like chromosome segregation protein Spo0J